MSAPPIDLSALLAGDPSLPGAPRPGAAELGFAALLGSLFGPAPDAEAVQPPEAERLADAGDAVGDPIAALAVLALRPMPPGEAAASIELVDGAEGAAAPGPSRESLPPQAGATQPSPDRPAEPATIVASGELADATSPDDAPPPAKGLEIAQAEARQAQGAEGDASRGPLRRAPAEAPPGAPAAPGEAARAALDPDVARGDTARGHAAREDGVRGDAAPARETTPESVAGPRRAEAARRSGHEPDRSWLAPGDGSERDRLEAGVHGAPDAPDSDPTARGEVERLLPAAERPRPAVELLALRSGLEPAAPAAPQAVSAHAADRPDAPLARYTAVPPREIGEPVAWLAQGGGGSVRLQLDPPHLGPVELRVRVRGSRVEVQMVARDDAVPALESQGALLGESLASRGLEMQRFEVTPEARPGAPADLAAPHSANARSGGAFEDGHRPRAREGAPWPAEPRAHRSEAARPLFGPARAATGSIDLRV
jgi:hypothetical protein